MRYRSLSEEQVEHFLSRGFIKLEDCFCKETAQQWIDDAFIRLGYVPDDPSTWDEARFHLPGIRRVEVRDFAPKVFDAICDLLGGEDRIHPNVGWSDGFIINFNSGADQPWQPPSPLVKGWHKDGDFFRHFLDSPEQGLLTLVLWDDVLPQSGGTFVACDSVPLVARRLFEHPEGLLPGGFGGLIENCHDFDEALGQRGDVYLLHPFILHSASFNPSGRPRVITNPPVGLREPMRFDREDPDDYSLVELAIIRGLGCENAVDWQRTGERERLVPERVRRNKKILEDQKDRLAAAGVAM
jgi:hypothetical protein